MSYEKAMINKNNLRASKINLLTSLEELCLITQKRDACYRDNDACKEKTCSIFWEIKSLRYNIYGELYDS